MILVAGSVRIRAETQAEALSLAVWMQQETRREPGCLEYTFSRDLEDPNLIHVFERWAAPEQLQTHFQSPHMARFNTLLPAYLAEQPSISRFSVADQGES